MVIPITSAEVSPPTGRVRNDSVRGGLVTLTEGAGSGERGAGAAKGAGGREQGAGASGPGIDSAGGPRVCSARRFAHAGNPLVTRPHPQSMRFATVPERRIGRDRPAQGTAAARRNHARHWDPDLRV